MENQNTPLDACHIWLPTQHTFFKTSMVLTALALLIPKNKGHFCILLYYVLLSVSMGVAVAWGLMICSPDLVIWHLLMFGANIIHLVYALTRIIPPRLCADSKQIYERHFNPYKVSKRSFAGLLSTAWKCELDSGHEYFREGCHGAGHNVSLLAKGRLMTTYRGCYLHDVRPLEFADSLEWQWRGRNKDRVDNNFQVTVTATEDSTLLCWRLRDIEALKLTDSLLYTVFDHIVAIDAISKLYRCSGRRTRLLAAKCPLPPLPEMASDRTDQATRTEIDETNKETT